MEVCNNKEYKPIAVVKPAEDRYGIGMAGSSNLSNSIVAMAGGKSSGKDYFWKKEIDYNGKDLDYGISRN